MLASNLGHYMAGCKLLYTQIQIQLLTKVWKLPLFRGTRIECYKGKYIEAMERHAILRLLNRKPLQYTTKEKICRNAPLFRDGSKDNPLLQIERSYCSR